MTYLFTVVVTICICIYNKNVYFIINMTYDTYDTHNGTTKLKQPKSVKNDKYL